MSRSSTTRLLAIVLLLGLVAVPGMAGAHAEREAFFPDGTGTVPHYRPMIADRHLVVCRPESERRIEKIENDRLRKDNKELLKECRFRNIQDAVNAVKRKNTTIYMLPGVYEEKPNRNQPKCGHKYAHSGEEEGAPILSYKQQLRCKHHQNLIGIFGDDNPKDDVRECNAVVCGLQLEGTGETTGDVLITGGFNKKGNFAKLNGIRADRADGVFFKNFTIELFEFNALYILETDGFVIDDVTARYNDEYGFLTFAVDHGVYKNCNGYNNGDSLIYPGSASDVNNGNEDYTQTERWAIEIFGCKSHHNALGYSGTAGDSVYVHDNEFFANQSGMVTDSIFPGHPGLPQNHGWYTDNLIYSNNTNYTETNVQSGKCDVPPVERGYKPAKGEPRTSGIVCPVVPAPVGAGMVIAGGNWNLIETNQVWDNWRAGFMLFTVPAAIREETDPAKAYDTSHFNRYFGNFMSLTPGGEADLNGYDFWWDDQGEGNCWQENDAPEGGVTSNTLYPLGLPDCDSGGSVLLPVNPAKSALIAACATYDRNDETLRDPPGCDFFDTPPEP